MFKRAGFALLCLTTTLLAAQKVQAARFVLDQSISQEVSNRIKIPVHFALPTSARLDLPDDIGTSDRLIDYRHPDGLDAEGNIGLRLVMAKRLGLAKRLAASGLVKTGDILLTLRPEWGGGGGYPSVQMGISHTGLAYLKNGIVHNLDNPLTFEYLGGRGQLDSEHYTTARAFHIIRPRGLSDAQRTRLEQWASRLSTNARTLYPKRISFNPDYNAPKYRPGEPSTFVAHFAQIAQGQPRGNVDMFCSEFVWALLALKNCDVHSDFADGLMPACINPPMRPMQATGTALTHRHQREVYAGLTDGPLLVINAMKLPYAERARLVRAIFIEQPDALARMSENHRQMALAMKPKLVPLEHYYLGMIARAGPTREAKRLAWMFNEGDVPDNYSPASFLINTLLPRDNQNRTMDYVATVVFD